MGTSSSYGGPSGRNPLLPPWAPEPTGQPAEPPQQPPEPGELPQDDTANPQDANPTRPLRPEVSWRSPKTAVGRFARGTGTAESVGRAYTRAGGGARAMSASSSAGRSSTQRLGGFLSGIARDGVLATAVALGIRDLVGRDAQFALEAFLERIAPEGSLREDSIAREAIIRTLTEMWERFAVRQQGIEALDRMGAAEVRELIVAAIGNYINVRFQQELLSRIERGAVSEQEANRLAKDIGDFIEAKVQLDLDGVDVLGVNWEGTEGGRLVEGWFTDAYGLLGGKQ